jgi:uncharacterized membrane protein
VFGLAVTAGAAAAAAPPALRVTIVAPAAGSATNAATAAVHVSFAAHGNVSELVLSIDGVDVARHQNPPSVKQGVQVFASGRLGRHGSTVE